MLDDKETQMSDNLTFEEALVDYPHLMHEVQEMRSEVERHHRDFQHIRIVLDQPRFRDEGLVDLRKAIRNIAG